MYMCTCSAHVHYMLCTRYVQELLCMSLLSSVALLPSSPLPTPTPFPPPFPPPFSPPPLPTPTPPTPPFLLLFLLFFLLLLFHTVTVYTRLIPLKGSHMHWDSTCTQTLGSSIWTWEITSITVREREGEDGRDWLFFFIFYYSRPLSS